MSKIILYGADTPAPIARALGGFADAALEMPRCAELDGAVSSHADMLGFSRGGALWLTRGYYEANAPFFDALGCGIVTVDLRYGPYPRDVYFNVFEYGGALYGRTDAVPAALAAAFGETAPVRQGYAKCSTLIFGGGCVTADAGIAAALGARGANVLRVRPGHVALPGFDTGFIGGACAVPAPDAVIPAGDLSTHPDGDAIRRFIEDAGARVIGVFAPGTGLFDFGGILVIEN